MEDKESKGPEDNVDEEKTDREEKEDGKPASGNLVSAVETTEPHVCIT